MTIEILNDGRRVRIGDTAAAVEPVDVASIWLRDACHCATCRRPTTNERRLDPTTIDPAITVMSASATDDHVVAITSDEHDVIVPWKAIAHVRRARAGHDFLPIRRFRQGRKVASHSVRRLTAPTDDDALLQLLDALAQDGAVLVDGVEPTADALRSLAERVGPIQPTNYESIWSIDAVVDPVTEVESNRPLLVHTDLPYRSDPPGVQFLLACETDVAGGATTLVDGVAAAERLAAIDPDGFDLLTRVPVEYPYVRADIEIVGSSPLIEPGIHGDVRVIRRAPDLMGSPAVRADDADRFFGALRRWWSMLDDPSATVSVPLRRGELLVFDNHRMLHGRTGFELGTSGRRVLRGCYLHHDDVDSRRAVLRRRTV